MSRLALAAIIAGAAAMATPALAYDSYTTRIEPRPFYGAVVTMEAGVRVWRPLPPTRQVIINPGGQTPLSLGFNDTRVYEYSRSDNYHYGDGGGDDYYSGGGYGFPALGRGKGRGHHNGRAAPMRGLRHGY